ncbi:hypothetical protein BDY19DRAFT_907670 [Irpex rosettiformis]|uniref:Uncharacterized protein n=1 Tax=Irpex rosettiformis TaxID=378272 RepID=A0ACB8TYN6_9APHY|nr:hypothetical protein BDY19DRAFT_907670 [Irpex rosettiformis]
MTTAATVAHASDVLNSQPQLSSTHDLKEIARPKELDTSKFLPLLKRWIQRERTFVKYSDVFGNGTSESLAETQERDPERVEFYRALLCHLPIKKDQLGSIPYLLPSGRTKFKPPTMQFGWLVSADEVKRRGLDKDQYAETEFTDFYEPGDPKRPKDAKLNDETGLYEVEYEVFSPALTLDGLLDQAKVDCGLADKEYGYGCWNYFKVGYIWDIYEEYLQDMWFITIYTNIDLLPQDPERHQKGKIPGPNKIREMQELLGLGDREPGWWFSVLGSEEVTWEQYRRERYF